MILTPATEKALSHGLLDVLIRAGLIAVLVVPPGRSSIRSWT